MNSVLEEKNQHTKRLRSNSSVLVKEMPHCSPVWDSFKQSTWQDSMDACK